MEIPNFDIFIRQRCDKDHFEKLQDGIQLLINTINKNNNKNNNKNQARIIKAFEKCLVSETILSIRTKIFFCAHLTKLLPLTFSNFVNSNIPSIL